MAEVLVSFDSPIADEFGTYHARAIGRQANDGMWEGWIEFLPVEGDGEVLATSIESRQPEHAHLAYWATGLTPVYLEGALRRARSPLTVRVRVPERPATEAPATKVRTARAAGPRPEAVLDPFDIGGRNLDILRQELHALNRPRLLNIIEAYHLNADDADLSAMSDHQLVHYVVSAVELRLPQRAR